MSDHTTAQSEVGRIQTVLLKHAREAFGSQEDADAQWRRLGHVDRPDFERACQEYDRFIGTLRELGAAVELMPAEPGLTLDSLYVRDAGVLTDAGLICGRMGKPARAGEPEALARALRGLGIPVLGEVSGEGLLEGGDVVWLTPRSLVVGIGYRTNLNGLRQLGELLGDTVDSIRPVHLPHWRGPADVFHLMSILSPVAHDLAVVYSPLLPVSFRTELLDLGYDLVEVPDHEFESMGCNVLAVAPRVCLMLAGNPVTRSRLEAAGAEVREYDGTEISLKGCGGPTCLTRPLGRVSGR